MSLVTRSQHITLAAVVAAFAAALLATAAPAQHCPLGHCGDEEDVTYMNLLQVHADSGKTQAMLMEEHRQRANSSLQHAPGNKRTIKTMFPYYHTSEEIRKKAELLSKDCGGAMTMQTLSEDGVDIDMVHIRAPKSNPVNKVFILFGEHAREVISPESAVRLMEILCGKADGMVPNVLLDSEFQLVLNGNPKSRKNVEEGEYCLRTNPNGVDLNRNWDEMWSGDDSMDQTNGGAKPFSEPETRIFKKLVEKYQPTTFLTVHSGTKGMYMPWAYDLTHTAHYNAPMMIQVLKELDETHCQCPYGAAGKEVGYPCPGTCLDWVYSKLRTPYVFAFEIYTSADRDSSLKQRWNEISKDGVALLQSGEHLGHKHFGELFNDFTSDFVQRRNQKEEQESNEACFSMFNPDTEEVYHKTVQNWAVAYLEMAQKIAKDIKEKKTDTLADNEPVA